MFNSEATRKFFSTLTESEGIKVQYERHTAEPRSYQGGKVVLPYPDEMTIDQWEGMAHKEVSYLYGENQWLLDPWKSKESSPQGQDELRETTKRILSDHIAERNRYGDYDGRDNALTRNRGRITKDLQTSQPQLTDSGVKLDEQGEIVKSVLDWDLRSRKEFMGLDIQLQGDYSKGSLSCKAFDSLIEESLMDCSSQEELDDLLTKILQFEPPEEQEDNSQGDDEDDTDGDSSDDNNSGSNGDPDASDDGAEQSEESDEESGEADEAPGEKHNDTGEEPQEGTSEPSDGEQGDSEGQSSQEEPSDSESQARGRIGDGTAEGSQINDDHLGTGEATTGEGEIPEVPLDISSVAKEFKDTSVEEGTQELLDAEKNYKRKYKSNRETYVPLGKQKIVTAKMFDDNKGNLDDYPGNKYDIDEYYAKSLVSRQIKKYLQALSQDSYLYGQKKGRLSNRSISRCYSGVREPRIFKQRKSTRLNNDTAVQLMMDCSGSMGGLKYGVAAASCLCLSNTLTAIGIAHEILGFAENYRLDTYEFKKFNEVMTVPKLTDRFCNSLVDTGCNADGESLTLGVERLLARPEKNKVMIIFSDGQPAGHFGGCGRTHLKGVCEKIETKTPVKLHGIGICSSAVREYYKSYQVISDPEQLDAALMELLKSQVV